MKLIKKNLLVFILAIPFVGISQSNNDLLTVMPPSPNVASLGKYGEVPVSLYTGIPNVTVPIYDIKNGNLSLPVSINYHAGGIKVEEMASSVGLGWSLNAGGVISVSVRGLPDENGLWQPKASQSSVENIMLSGDPVTIPQLVKDTELGTVDGEADLYYFNFGQYSGKFFYDQAGNIHTVPIKQLSISRISGGWKVITEDGTVYQFTQSEVIGSSSGSYNQSTFSAWYLSSIQSSDGKRLITFTYDPIQYGYSTLSVERKYVSVNGASCLPNPTNLQSYQQYFTYRLNKIDFEQGYLKFNYNNNRCDLINDKSLDLIELYTNDNVLLKKFNFQYDYFGNNSDGCQSTTAHLKRLKLLSVVEQSGTESKQPYAFQYDESVTLPSRFSYAQDHWGSYNGKTSNTSLIPTFVNITQQGNQQVVPGADRRTNPVYAKAGTLTKITYPTGGETLFTYESNQVSDDWVDPDYTESSISLSATNYLVTNLPIPYQSSTTLTIPTGGAMVEISASGLTSPLWQGCDIVECQVIKDGNPVPYTYITTTGSPLIGTWPAGTYRLKLVTQCGTGSIANFDVNIIARIPITNTLNTRNVGGLRIKKMEDNPGDGGIPIIKRYKYYLPSDTTKSSGVLTNYPVYGYDLQVALTQYDGNGSIIGVTNCSYRARQSSSNYPLATTQGSYVGYSNVIIDYGTNGESHYTYVSYQDLILPTIPFAPNESFDWRRGALLSSKDYLRSNSGLILVKEVTNSYNAINEFRVYGIKTFRNYLEIGPPMQSVLPVYAFYPLLTEFHYLSRTVERTYVPNDLTKFIDKQMDYVYSPNHYQLLQSTTNAGNGIEEIVSYTKYPFDYSFSGSPSGNESLGIKKLQELKVSSAPIEQYVVKQNRDINNQLSNQRIISGFLNTYRSDNPYVDRTYRLEANVPIPQSTFGTGSSLVSNVFVKSSYYGSYIDNRQYDTQANLIEQSKTNNVKHAYLYGYAGNYPIAEVTNSDNVSIAHTSFESADVLGNGNWLFTGTLISNSLAPTGVKCYNLSNGSLQKNGLSSTKTYVISFWYYTGASVTVSGSPTNISTRPGLNNWTFKQQRISGVTSVSLTGSGLIDEVRLYPVGAQMTTYTYLPLFGAASASDANGLINYYVYDVFGRLQVLLDDRKNILKSFQYHYKGQATP